MDLRQKKTIYYFGVALAIVVATAAFLRLSYEAKAESLSIEQAAQTTYDDIYYEAQGPPQYASGTHMIAQQFIASSSNISKVCTGMLNSNYTSSSTNEVYICRGILPDLDGNTSALEEYLKCENGSVTLVRHDIDATLTQPAMTAWNCFDVDDVAVVVGEPYYFSVLTDTVLANTGFYIAPLASSTVVGTHYYASLNSDGTNPAVVDTAYTGMFQIWTTSTGGEGDGAMTTITTPPDNYAYTGNPISIYGTYDVSNSEHPTFCNTIEVWIQDNDRGTSKFYNINLLQPPFSTDFASSSAGIWYIRNINLASSTFTIRSIAKSPLFPDKCYDVYSVGNEISMGCSNDGSCPYEKPTREEQCYGIDTGSALGYIECALIRALSAVFYPETDLVDQFKNNVDKFKNVQPFVYYTAYTEVMDELTYSNSTSTTILLPLYWDGATTGKAILADNSLSTGMGSTLFTWYYDTVELLIYALLFWIIINRFILRGRGDGTAIGSNVTNIRNEKIRIAKGGKIYD